MENRYSDFYEGTTDKKLKNILDVVIYNLRDNDNFIGLLEQAVKTTGNLTWNGLDSLEKNGLASFLEHTARTLVESKDDMTPANYRKIQQVIEPLEIVITEIKMAHIE